MATKEPIKLRRREMPTGNISLYLDIYIDGRRTYEYLKLYLIPERKRADKETNRQTLMLAEAIRAKRIVDLQNGRFGFNKRPSTTLISYYGTIAQTKRNNATARVYRCAGDYIDKYCAKGFLIKEADSVWLQGFARYLDDEGLTNTTIRLYLTILKAVFNQAVADQLIEVSPFAKFNMPHCDTKERQYLTKEELRLMIDNMELIGMSTARSFIFACLTGLRHSDVCKLTWGDVTDNGGYTRLTFRQQKTSSLQYYDISPDAIQFMGKRRNNADLVFFPSHNISFANRQLERWTAMLGISKHITFHCSRHTFAMMALDLGIDIYTISKLLGHTSTAHTQVYAKMQDRHLQQAVARIHL